MNLREQIEYHDRLYEKGTPEISDEEYDALKRKLSAEDPLHDYRFGNKMQSLAKVYTVDELLRWAKKVARSDQELFLVGPKYDGVSARLENDKLVTGPGEDISDKLSFLLRVEPPFDGPGEIVVLKSNLLPGYKTCRAMAVGLLGTKELSVELNKRLTFYSHWMPLDPEPFTLSEILDIDWMGTMEEERARVYPTDGLVVWLADQEYFNSLGGTEHHPHGAVAFKYTNPMGRSKLIDVEWQVGKYKVTPVGIIEPVVISGCEHNKVSLHNMDRVRELGLRIGAEVLVERCGDVIPQITKVLVPGKGGAVLPPAECPACGSRLTQDLGCVNKSCGGTAAKKLLDSLTRLGFESIGPKIASELVARYHRTVPEVFDMDLAEWLKVPGFAERSAQQMLTRIKALLAQSVEDYKVLAAMNIPGVGLALSRQICDKVNVGMLDFTKPDAAGTVLINVPGLGIARVDAICENFDIEFWNWVHWYWGFVSTFGQSSRPQVCFTGNGGESRGHWIQLAESKGYVFSKGVTKTLSVLVCEDVNGSSSKLVKARKYGVKFMTYEEFQNELQQREG